MIIYNQTKTEELETFDANFGYLVLDEEETQKREDGEQVYIFTPYTADQLDEYELLDLRNDREAICFTIVNRGVLWYNTLTEEQKIELNNWYLAWLDVTETRIVPQKPEWLK